MPIITFRKESDRLIYNVQLAGVDADDFIVEISNGLLLLFHQMWLKEDMEVPYLLNQFIIPPNVNVDEISAEYENGNLRVIMPVDEFSHGYRRNVDILKH